MAAITLPPPGTAPRRRVWEPLKVRRRRLAASVLRRRVSNRRFSIISNDCWAGMVYEELGIRYETPFVGLFLVLDDYMRLLRRLRFYCGTKLEFRTQSRHEAINAWRESIGRHYPIGRLDDIEIQFMHYATEEEAEDKWTRRVQRINWDNLFVKICWHDDPRMEGWLREFEALPFARKLAFVPRAVPGLSCTVPLPEYTTDGSAQYWRSHLCLDVAAWLNRGVICRRSGAQRMNWLFYWHY